MSDGWITNILLGLGIIGLLVLIAWLVRRFYVNVDGFQVVPGMIDIDTYMSSIGETYTRKGDDINPSGFKCTDPNYELVMGQCYIKCDKSRGYIGVADKCVPQSATGTYPRELLVDATTKVEIPPTCPFGYTLSMSGPRLECGGAGQPACPNVAPKAIPTCMEICPYGMLQTSASCKTPADYDQPAEPYVSTYSCQGQLPTRYIRIDGKFQAWLSIGNLVAIDSQGNQISLKKPTTCSSSYKAERAGTVPPTVTIGASPSPSIPVDGTLFSRSFDSNQNTQGWHSGFSSYTSPTVNSVDYYPWWEVDLGSEVVLQSVTMYQRNDGSTATRVRLKGFKISLLDADRNINYRYFLTDTIFHNFRLYDSGTPTNIVMPELALIPPIATQVTILSAILSEPPGTYVTRATAVPEAGTGKPSGTIKSRYLFINGKEEYINVYGINITLVDGTSFTITPGMVTTPGNYGAGWEVTNNLTRYHSSTQTGRWVDYRFYGETTTPFVWIDFKQDILIDTILIKNRNDSEITLARLDGFKLRLFDNTKTLTYITMLTKASEQTYQIYAGLKPEFEVCTTPCAQQFIPSVYRHPVTGEVLRLTCTYNSRTGDNTDTRFLNDYIKNFIPSTETRTCPVDKVYDAYRLPTAVSNGFCSTTPARNTTNSSDLFYYCSVKYSPTPENIRETTSVIPYTCPSGYYLFDEYSNGAFNKICLKDTGLNISIRVAATRATCPSDSVFVDTSTAIQYKPEVYGYGLTYDTLKENAEAKCNTLGGTLASYEQLVEVQSNAGADWCTAGWVSNKSDAFYPSTTNLIKECGNGSAGIKSLNGGLDLVTGKSTMFFIVNCYGPKPPQGTAGVRSLNSTKYSRYDLQVGGSISGNCMKKTVADIRKENPPTQENGTPGTPETVNYTRNVACMFPCRNGYINNRVTRNCTAGPSFQQRARLTSVPTCPTGYVYDKGRCYKVCTNPLDVGAGNTCYPAGTPIIMRSPYDAVFVPEGCPPEMEMIQIGSSSKCYPICKPGYMSSGITCVVQSINPNNYTNSKVIVPNIKAYLTYMIDLPTYTLKAGRGGMVFPPNNAIPKDTDFPNYFLYRDMVKNAPVNLVNDWITPPPTSWTLPTVSAVIYGTVDVSVGSVIKGELDTSLSLAKRIYLGSPDDIDKYLLVDTDNLKPYIRNEGVRDFCKPEVTQRVSAGEIIVEANGGNHSFNTSNCRTEVTPDLLSMFSYPARNFVKQWIYNRTRRMIDFKYTTESDGAISNRKNALQVMQPSTYGLDIKNKLVLDSIAQSFYNMIGGRFTMTYMYDIMPLGSRIIDVRFDMTQHKNPDIINSKILDLQRKYTSILSSKALTQDILDQAKEDYQSALDDLLNEQGVNIMDSVKGMYGRFFYRLVNNSVVIDGFTLDQRVVTSFIQELNCGFPGPVTGDDSGNVNYTPITLYLLNQTEVFNCSSPDIVKRVMQDYVDMIMDPEADIAYRSKGPVAWDASGTLVVTQVIGATQVSPKQCAYTWKESAYDDSLNAPTASYKDVVRSGIFSYVANTDDWYANNLIFDISGFTLLGSPTVNACIWQPSVYRNLVGKRTFGMTDNEAFEDYFIYGMRESRSLCPSTNPGFVFDPLVYARANSLTQFTGEPPNAVGATNHYKNIGKELGSNVANAFTIATLSSPITIERALPSEESSLDTASDLCPEATCQDINVLYTLVDQYNNDPTLSGVILRVKRAITNSSNSCHVEVEIDWAAQIEDPADPRVKARLAGEEYIGNLTGAIPKIVKGLSARPKGAPAGLETTTLKIPTHVDSQTCTYQLDFHAVANPVVRGSGVNIQANTPALYKPMEYATEAKVQILRDTGIAIDSVKGLSNAVLAKARTAAMKYRGETYAAVGDIQTLEGCPDMTCSSPTILQTLASYFRSQNLSSGILMKKIERAGTLDSTTCDITYTKGLTGETGSTTAGARFKLRPTAMCIFDVASMTEIPATPDWPIMSNLSLVKQQYVDKVNTASTYKQATVNYTPTESFQNYGGAPARRPATREFIRPPTQDAAALNMTAFGRDSARNQTAFALTDMYTTPLFQEEIVAPRRTVGAPRAAIIATQLAEEEDGATAYKYIRFRPIKTRSAAADSVAIGHFAFFYGDKELRMDSVAVSNPMGDWVGRITDVAGPGRGKGFVDNYKKPIVFAFPVPVTVNGFSFTTSASEKTGADPVRWKLEGSHNGTFWQLLHDQTVVDYPLPMRRGADLPVFKF